MKHDLQAVIIEVVMSILGSFITIVSTLANVLNFS